LEQNSIYIFIPDEKLKIYGDLLRIITAQSMEYFSCRPPEHKQMILFCLDEFASFGKLQITEALRKLRKRHIRIMVLTQSLADLDMIYGKDERKAMLGNFKFTVLLGCKDTETQEYFSKMIGEKHTLLVADTSQKPQPIIKPADLAHLEQDLIVICDDGAVRLHKNFYFK
jgi:type IV secretory pathway TraG/TraD family ATPase VirD4